MTTSLEQLRHVIGNAGPGIETLCDDLLATFVTEPIDDDIAIVALHRT